MSLNANLRFCNKVLITISMSIYNRSEAVCGAKDHIVYEEGFRPPPNSIPGTGLMYIILIVLLLFLSAQQNILSTLLC